MTNIVLASTCTIAGIGDTQASASTVVSTQPTRTADRTVARTPPVTTMIPPTEATATWFDVAETHDRHRDLDPVSPSRSRCALIMANGTDTMQRLLTAFLQSQRFDRARNTSARRPSAVRFAQINEGNR